MKQAALRSILVLLIAAACFFPTHSVKADSGTLFNISPTEIQTTEGVQSTESIQVRIDGYGTNPNVSFSGMIVTPDNDYTDLGMGPGVARHYTISCYETYACYFVDERGNRMADLVVPVSAVDDNIVQGTHQTVISIEEQDQTRDSTTSPWTTSSDLSLKGQVTNIITDNDVAPSSSPTPVTSGGSSRKSPSASATVPAQTSTSEPKPDVSLDAFDPYQKGESQAIQLKNGQVAAFSIAGNNGNETHTATVESLDNNSVKLLIASQPFEVTLKPGETGEYDVTDDPINDIQIKVLSITDGVATLSFKRIHSPAGSNPAATSEKHMVTVKPTVTKPTAVNKAVWVAAGLVLIALAGTAFWFRRTLIRVFRKIWQKLSRKRQALPKE